MKRIYAPLFFVLTFLVLSCSSQEGEQTVNIEKRYSLELPAFLSEVDNLHDEASLQYQNMFNEFYVIVIDEPKEVFHNALDENDLNDAYSRDVDGYTEIVLDAVVTSLDDPEQSELIETNVNGMATRLTTIKGIVDDIPIYYAYGIYEGRDTYYQVIAWTLSDKQSKYEPKMEAILHSLKEFNTQGKRAKTPSTNEKSD